MTSAGLPICCVEIACVEVNRGVDAVDGAGEPEAAGAGVSWPGGHQKLVWAV